MMPALPALSSVVLELRQTTYPPRGGDTVYFAWPKGIPVSDPEAAIVGVQIKYEPLDGWEILRWTTDTIEGDPVIVACQLRARRVL
jgi:hypothetical protein